jgi:hypothetical protein
MVVRICVTGVIEGMSCETFHAQYHEKVTSTCNTVWLVTLFTCSHLMHLRVAAFLITYVSEDVKSNSSGVRRSHTVIQSVGWRTRRLRFNLRANLCTGNGPQAKIGGYKHTQPINRNLIALSVGVDQGRREFHSMARSVLGNSTARENNTFEMSSELSITITNDGTTSYKYAVTWGKLSWSCILCADGKCKPHRKVPTIFGCTTAHTVNSQVFFEFSI